MDKQSIRLALYRKIEVARKQLPDMDEDAFRALLRSEFGVESRKQLAIHELSRLVHHFAGLGVKFTAPAKAKKHDVRPHSRTDWVEITDSMPYAQEKRQIAAIWRKLGYSMPSLDQRVKRAFGVELFVWMQDRGQISTLLSDLQRREKSFDRKAKAAARAANA